MDNWQSSWNVSNYLIYLQLIVIYSKCRSKKRKKELKWDLETLRAGYLPVKYLKYK